MGRRLFEDLVVCRSEGSPGSARMMPASVALHALVLGGFVLAPLLASSELPAPPTPSLAPIPWPAVAIRAGLERPSQPPGVDRVAARPTPPARAFVVPREVPPAVSSSNDVLEGDGRAGISGRGAGGCIGGNCDGDGPTDGPPFEIGAATDDRVVPAPRPARIGGDLRPPKKLHHVTPEYPEVARRAGIGGVVILECTLDPSGHVSDVQVLRGHPLLDASAVAAVRQWRYSPTYLNGVATPVIMTVTVTFNVERKS